MDLWGFQRAGRKIQKRVSRAIDRLVQRGEVVTREEFVSLAERDGDVPVRSRAIDGASFKAEHIAPKEIAVAVKLLLQIVPPCFRTRSPPRPGASWGSAAPEST